MRSRLESLQSRLRQSPTLRRSAWNAAYNTADYLAVPLLMLLATPFFVARLGLDRYGLWMLANAVAGTVGVFSTGLGDATIKYVAHHRARGDTPQVVRTVQVTLAVYAGLGTLLAAALAGLAPLLARSVFKIDAVLQREAVLALWVASAGLLIRAVDGVLSATLKGYERYDLAARISVSARTLGLVAAVVLVWYGYGVTAALAATLTAVLAGVGAGALVCRRLVPGFRLAPRLDSATAREVLGFGVWTWLQSVAAVVFGQADRLVIGAMLGPAPLGAYSVCLQLAQQVHSLSAAALHFMFPLVSARAAAGGPGAVRQVYRRALWASIAGAAALALPLALLARPILHVWMGGDFADQNYALLVWLTVAFLLLAINIVPYNTLLGLGQVRFVSLTNLGGGALALAGALLLIPVAGLMGAAVGRLFYGPVIGLNYLRMERYR